LDRNGVDNVCSTEEEHGRERKREREERIDGGREGGESSVPSQVRVAQLSAPVSVCMTGVSILHPT
jgi:hypothetical protein